MTDELKKLMVAYSERGVRDWRSAERDLKTAATHCLSHAIVDKTDEAKWAIGTPRTRQPKFIPMPRHGFSGIDWCFFLPRKVLGDLESLVLFVLVDHKGEKCIAFRFEGSSAGPHGYRHVQLTPKLRKHGEIGCMPAWVPDSYPAFPIPARDWTQVFLAMVTSVHGYAGGVDHLIRDIFQEEQKPDDARRYMRILDEMLVRLN